MKDGLIGLARWRIEKLPTTMMKAWVVSTALVLAGCQAPSLNNSFDAGCVETPGAPWLQWNTFVGGPGTEYGNKVAVAADGSIYFCGMSNQGWGNPIRAFGDGNWDAFIAKLDPSGALVWNTFLGMNSAASDTCLGLAVDATGRVYAAGRSDESWDTPIRPFTGPDADAYVVALSSNGTLLWHTFLGGPGYDIADGIALDGAGNIYLAGESVDTWGTPLRAHGPGDDFFVAKLSPSGNLLWNTFLGPSTLDLGAVLAVQPDGTSFVAGTSRATWGAPLRAFAGGGDAFVARLDANGNLMWNTFLGSAAPDEARAITIDTGGDLVVSGLSESTWGTPLRAYSAQLDGFVARLDVNGGLRWHTFLGGSDWDIIDDLANASRGGVYFSGWSGASWGNPALAYSGGRSDALVGRLEADGGLAWHAFLGGDAGVAFDDDYGNSLAATPSGQIYVVGDSDTLWGTPLSSPPVSHNGFIARLEDPSTCVPVQAPRAHELDVGLGCHAFPGVLGGPGALMAWWFYFERRRAARSRSRHSAPQSSAK